MSNLDLVSNEEAAFLEETHEYAYTPEDDSEGQASSSIDPTVKHLRALGFVEKDPIYYRAIGSIGNKSDARKLKGIGFNVPTELKSLNSSHGIYFVVNGCGDLDKDVSTGRAVFYEHDNLPKEIQVSLWKTLRLPEPTLQVDTGGKSIHSYWVFRQPIPIEDWKILQKDLLDFADADRSIKNPARVMRLAGFNHKKTGVQSSIILNSGKRYSFDELRSVIKKPEVKPSLDLSVTTPKRDRSFDSSKGDVPLFQCLSINNRELIQGGAGQGSRNLEGFALAADLIGTEDYLSSKGQRFEGNSRSLFDDFCNRCNPPLEEAEIEGIWRSASGRSGGPTLSDKYLKNCIDAWYRADKPIDREVKLSQADGVEVIPASKKTKDYGPKKSEFALELEDLDSTEVLEDVAKLKKTIKDAWGKVSGSVPQAQRTIFEGLAQTGGIPAMVHLLTVLGVVSTFVSATHIVDVPRKDKTWTECLNVFLAIIGPAGCGKSESQDSAVAPIQQAQEVYTQRWKDDVKHFDSMSADAIKEAREDGTYEKPVLHVVSFNGGTLEALITSMANGYRNHKTSILWQSDELSRIFDALNKHNKGSDDLKTMLEMFNGKYLSKQTIGGGIVSTPKSVISIIGGIQESEWVLYCKKLSNSKSGSGNGFSGRWLNAYIPQNVSRQLEFGGDRSKIGDPITNFVTSLKHALSPLEPIDVIMKLDEGATAFCSEIETWKVRGSKNTGLNNHYAKGTSYVYRLGALLALINDPRTTVISRVNLESAMAIVDYSIAVATLLEYTGDSSTAQGVVDGAYKLALRKGELNANLMAMNRVGIASDRQAIIQKVADTHGGTLTTNRVGKLVWKP